MASDEAMRNALPAFGGSGMSSKRSAAGYRRGEPGVAAPSARADSLAGPHDQDADYPAYWAGRRYEHRAEVMAVSRLLHGHRFGHAVDVGGGFGRISVILRHYAARVTVTDPSIRQLELAERYLHGRAGMDTRLMDAAHLDFDDDSVDLVVMVRLLHHLPDPADALCETARILKTGGYAVIEAANVLHAINRARCLVSRKTIAESPVDIRSRHHRQQGGIPFVSHHPERLMLQLAVCGLQVERMLSVSNLRHPVVKRIMPERLMLAAEYVMQVPLAPAYFGPSMFFLVRKQDLAQDRPATAAMPVRPAHAAVPAVAGER